MGERIELADILRVAGPAFRAARAGRLSLAELKVMSAIENCRTVALGGHVEGCDACGHLRIAYNSCRNRHCPQCQGAPARDWLTDREADLLPVGYFHVVFTLPAEIGVIALGNKRAVYDLLFRASVETMTTIAADPKRLGARIGLTAVLHTWGSAMTHHPHIHMIVPGGGLSPDGTRWITSRPAFLLPVRVLGALFRRLFLEGLAALYRANQLAFHGTMATLADPRAFARHLAPARRKRWVVYAKPPFAGPEAILAYLPRYTHRVAISSRRITAFDGRIVTFRVKDYRQDGAARHRTLTLEAAEFIRRFLLHVLPRGFHRIRHHGFLTGTNRKAGLDRIRVLLGASPAPDPATAAPDTPEPPDIRPPCPCCGRAMSFLGTLLQWRQHEDRRRIPHRAGSVRHDSAWDDIRIRPKQHAPGEVRVRSLRQHELSLAHGRRIKGPFAVGGSSLTCLPPPATGPA